MRGPTCECSPIRKPRGPGSRLARWPDRQHSLALQARRLKNVAEEDFHAAHPDRRLILERGRGMRRQRALVEECAVRAAEIFDRPLAAAEPQHRVPPAHAERAPADSVQIDRWPGAALRVAPADHVLRALRVEWDALIVRQHQLTWRPHDWAGKILVGELQLAQLGAMALQEHDDLLLLLLQRRDILGLSLHIRQHAE